MVVGSLLPSETMRAHLVPAVVVVLMAAFVALPHQAYAQEASTYAVGGIVVDEEGRPVQGASVSGHVAYDGGDATQKRLPSWGSATTTDDAGAFTLELPAGQATITAWSPDSRRTATLDVEVKGNTTGLRLALPAPPPKTASVEGRVLDAAGKPIAGATVRLDAGCCYAQTRSSVTPTEGDGATSGESAPSVMPIWCCDEGEATTTDAEGRYAFRTSAGPRQLTASAKGHADASRQVEAVANETVHADLTLVAIPASDAKLTGRITDAITGAPVKDAQVSVRSMEWGRYAWAATGSDGAYSLTLLPGWTAIDVHVDAYRAQPLPAGDAKGELTTTHPLEQYYAHTQVVKLASGANDVDIALERKPVPSIALVGYVVDPDAQEGVAGATVSFWNQDTGDWGSARTDETGSFAVLVREGRFQAHASKDGHLGGQVTFTVRDGAAKRVDVPLPKGEARYAPCGADDPACGGPILYAEGKAASAPASEEATRSDAANAPEVDRTGEAQSIQYAGTGGGLPKYDPARADETPRASSSGAAPVPFVGLGALVVALAAVAIILRRR